MPKIVRPNPEKADADNPRWTDRDFERAVPFSELPKALRETLRRRGPQKAPRKELISIRLSRDVVEQLRASGQGWQARVDEHLRDWVNGQQQPALKKKRRSA